MSSISKNRKSSKPTTIEELDEDLLFEILHRLPLPSLLQCKSVNKNFQSVISDPNYLHSRLNHHRLSPGAFETHTLYLFHFRLGSNYDKVLFSINFNNKTHILKGSNFLPFSWPQDRDRVRVKATHHDLILLCNTQSEDRYIHYFVCNPFTKQYVVLPPLRMSQAHELARVGFMCDHSRSRFRVVHIPIVCFQMVDGFQVNMFSSETGEWSASNVAFPRSTIMSNWCFRNILVYNEKFVWWILDGFFVCDPFNAYDSTWRLIYMRTPCNYFHGAGNYNIYHGICNGRIMICEFLRTNSVATVHELVNLEENKWSGSRVYRGVDVNNMTLLAFHPHYEYIMYFFSDKGIFLCDYKNRTLEPVYTAVDEDLRACGNLMSLVLPQCPTPLLTLNPLLSGKTNFFNKFISMFH